MKEISLMLTYPRGSAFIVIWMLAMVSVSGKDIARRAVMEEVPMTAVRVQDTFWSPRLKTYRQKTISGSWKHVNSAIELFECATTPGRTPDPKSYRGFPEANLHKILETAAYALAQQPDAELENLPKNSNQ